MRAWIGVGLAALAMYAWGFAYWGASAFPYAPWLETADDAAAGAALREHFPESGVYFVPARSNDPETRAALYDQGPVGFVVLERDGRPEFDPGIMVRGFGLNVVIAALLLLLFRGAGLTAAGHGRRIGLAAMVAVILAVVVHAGDVVWWVKPFGWELSRAFYNATAVVLGAAVVSAFLPGPSPDA